MLFQSNGNSIISNWISSFMLCYLKYSDLVVATVWSFSEPTSEHSQGVVSHNAEIPEQLYIYLVV